MFGKTEKHTGWLEGVALFEGFSHEELQRVAELGEEVDFDAGAVVVDQGDPGLDCYVVAEGIASVYVAGDYVAAIRPGSMIGEMALVDHRPRNATVVADTPMRLLRLRSQAFRTLLDEMPKASERVMAILTARLRRS